MIASLYSQKKIVIICDHHTSNGKDAISWLVLTVFRIYSGLYNQQ